MSDIRTPTAVEALRAIQSLERRELALHNFLSAFKYSNDAMTVIQVLEVWRDPKADIEAKGDLPKEQYKTISTALAAPTAEPAPEACRECAMQPCDTCPDRVAKESAA